MYKEDRPKNPNDFTLKFKAILRDMGCERATFASLRDTFAVEALNHGIDIRTLTCALGYRSYIAPSILLAASRLFLSIKGK